MQRLLGRLVLVALVVFGVWYVVDHYHGVNKFGCQASGAVAHADNNNCPASMVGWWRDNTGTMRSQTFTGGAQ